MKPPPQLSPYEEQVVCATKQPWGPTMGLGPRARGPSWRAPRTSAGPRGSPGPGRGLGGGAGSPGGRKGQGSR